MPSRGYRPFEVRSSGAEYPASTIRAEFFQRPKEPYQIHGQFIVSQIKSGFLLIDQQAASERILYEHYLQALGQQPIATQKPLFPKTVDLPAPMPPCCA